MSKKLIFYFLSLSLVIVFLIGCEANTPTPGEISMSITKPIRVESNPSILYKAPKDNSLYPTTKSTLPYPMKVHDNE